MSDKASTAGQNAAESRPLRPYSSEQKEIPKIGSRQPLNPKRWRLRIILAVIILSFILTIVIWRANNFKLWSKERDGPIYEVARGEMLITVVENGDLKAVNSVKIMPQIRGSAKIVSLIEEGKKVNKGDLLIELDPTDLTKRIDSQELEIARAESELVKAQEDCEIQKMTNDSEIRKAKLKVQSTKMELDKYLSENGDWDKQRSKAEFEITKYETKLKTEKEKHEEMKNLLDQGFMTENQVEEHALTLEETKRSLEMAKLDHDLLVKYTYPKDLAQKKSDYSEALSELERTQHKAKSQITQAEARIEQAKRSLALRKSQLKTPKEDLDRMTIRAPGPGLVIYGYQGYWGGQELRVGTEVYRGRVLLTLPDMSRMKVELKINEVDIHNVQQGLKTVIRLDAIPDLELHGCVTKVASVADSRNRWYSPDVKVFPAEVEIEESDKRLRPGLSAKVEIIVDRLEDVIYCPVQAVFIKDGQEVCYVYEDGKYTPTAVTVGLSNANYIEIRDGLAEGMNIALFDPKAGEGTPMESSAKKNEVKSNEQQ